MAKSTAKYSLLPSEDEPLLKATSDDEEDLPSDISDLGSDTTRTAESPGEQQEGGREGRAQGSFPPNVDPRFEQPPPAMWKRAALLFVMFFAFWLAFQIKGQRAGTKVVHANRYSKEYKYRPAASPIITETLKDGRLRVRGAAPTTSATPTPTPTPLQKSKAKKRKSGKKKGKPAKAARGKTGKTGTK